MRPSPPLERSLSREAALCVRVNQWCSRPSTRLFFSVISRLGNGAVWYALMASLVLVDGLHGMAVSAQIAATGVVGLTLYRLLKRWTRRPRPFASHRGIQAWVAPLDEYSFPSGHTLHAVAFTVVALAYYPMLGWVLIPLTTSIAISRVVLGLHYPSDVMAATGIGAALGGLSLWLATAAALAVYLAP
jgi:undecaprenyl-diphosphatase